MERFLSQDCCGEGNEGKGGARKIRTRNKVEREREREREREEPL